MSIFDVFNTTTTTNKRSAYTPEPSFLITITPNLNNSDTQRSGQSLVISGFKDAITSVQILISGNKQITTICHQDSIIAEFEGIYIKSFSFENFITEQHGSAFLDITVVNYAGIISEINKFSQVVNSNYDLASPFIDLFQAGYIVSMIMFNDGEYSVETPLFVGAIGDIEVDYDSNNIDISIPVESFLTILNRSACVQTSSNRQDSDGKDFLNTITAKSYNFNDLLQTFLNETIVFQSLSNIQYYKAPDEIEAIGNNGSAISNKSTIFVNTAPTSSKLKAITEALYPYQRVFYVNNQGEFIITPLQAYYDDDSEWDFTFNNESSCISGAKISVKKSTSSIQNRSFISIFQIFTQFNPSNATGDDKSTKKTNAYAIAIPNKETNYYPRLTQFIESGEYLQTLFATQEINKNLIQNSGLLNIAINFNNVSGLVNKAITVNGNQNYITTTDEDSNKIKYYVTLYAAKALAEQLFSETKVTIRVPTNLTYHQRLARFRDMPLNQLVTLPYTENNLFDNIPQYFCYGYKLTYNIEEGAMTELYLTKPYTYTALWSDEKVELMAVGDIGALE